MRTKKIRLQCLSGVVKSAQDGAVYIEGYANRKTVDRADEIIESDAWTLDDYKKNPVILYNHGMDAKLGQTPVGKCEKIEPRDDGLYVKAKVSSVDDPDINRVRELVKEGMLRAFSVGFSCKDSIMDDKGIRRIKKADLFEISIVGVPMNQDSLFSISGKMLSTKSLDQIGAKVCKKKGALAASAIHGKMYEMLKDGEHKREDVLSKVAEMAGVSVDDLKPALAGDVTPIPEKMLEAFASVLEMSLDDLKKMEAEEAQPEAEAEAEMEAEPEAEIPEEEPEVEVEVSVEEKADAAFQECVSSKIPQLLKEGKEQDQAVAIAISMCKEGKGEKCQVTNEQYQMFFDIASNAMAGEVVEKQAGQEGVLPVTTEMAAAKSEAENNDYGNPHLEAQKQTNVFLGQLIAEIQKMSAKLDQMQGGTPKPEPQPEPVPEPAAGTPEEKEKAALDLFNKRLENCIIRLKALGVE
jgi:HK97 family phage prohead protease